MTDLDVLVEQAHNRIRNALLECENPTIAFSGGKDALVVAHLMAQHGVTDGACELSFYYQRQEDNIREQAAKSGFNITFYRRLDDDWLRRRNHIIFTSDAAARAASFAARQQKTVATHAKKNRHDLIAFGRRTEENSVPRHLYKNKAGWSFHPIRDWRERHVWEYLDSVGIPAPWIYGTRHGELEGNSGFFTLRARDVGGYHNAWRLVSDLDPRFTPERYGITL